MKQSKQPWYKNSEYINYQTNFDGSAGYYNYETSTWVRCLFGQAFTKYCLDSNLTVRTNIFSGFFPREKLVDMQKVYSWLADKEFYCVSESLQPDNAVVINNVRFYLHKDGILKFYSRTANKENLKDHEEKNISESFNCQFEWSNSEFPSEFEKDFKKEFNTLDELPSKNTKEMYVIGQNRSGLTLQSVGIAGIPLDYDHYTESIHEKIKFLSEELEELNPFGRLSIVEGPPGTGKTFLIRGLIDSVDRGRFVFVPSALVTQLSNPGFVSLLLEYASDSFEADEINPLILILEDADKVLLDRRSDNLEQISNLLNLTSGILGDALDIRVIATTNQTIKALDDAVKRDGRLNCHIHVGNLTLTEAGKLYKKLTGKTLKLSAGSKGIPLSKVYKLATKEGILPSQNKQKNKLLKRKGVLSSDCKVEEVKKTIGFGR